MRLDRATRTSPASAAGLLLALAVAAAARGQFDPEPGQPRPAGAAARGAAAERECLFLQGTAIPKLAMGVCRPGDPPDLRTDGELRLWSTTSPAEGEEPAAIRPLFTPLYVYEERPGVGTTWYRLGDAYAAPDDGTKRRTGPLGWADGRRLHLLDNRYAYHFSNPERVKPGVQLYATKAAAYAALGGGGGKPPADGAAADVIVAERLDEDAWDPLAAAAVPPFVELNEPPAQPGADNAKPGADGAAATPDASLTDTTLTFPYGENRLVRLGAVGGGAVDRKKLANMEQDAQARAGIEIVFVIDETRSMKPWFGQVADFIQDNLALGGNTTNVKIAVSWYSDLPQDNPKDVEPYDVHPLESLVGAKIDADAVDRIKAKIVKDVRDHRERIVDDGGTVRELMFQGLVAAIKAAKFTAGENAMVFVIGDAADRSSPKQLESQYGKIADLVKEHNLQLAFIQVGDPNDADAEFVKQAEALRQKLPADKQASVVIEGVNKQALKMRIADIQARMEAKRQKLLREIDKVRARNCYAAPGPVMARLIEADGMTLKQFDERNMQYFAPAYGWLYNPQNPGVDPQLRELVFLAKAEEDALVAALKDVAGQITKFGKVDGGAAVKKLAAVLAKNSGHSQVEAVLNAAWDAMPEEERTLGKFLRDVMGLRVRNALLFHRGEMKPGPATERAVAFLGRHAERLAADKKRPGAVWTDVWLVLP